jgi:chromate reductase
LFNEDVEVLGVPESVNSLCKKILDAGAVVIACPEYNYSISGVLKNALDWVSRHPQKPLAGKKTALMGASMGRFGTARAQYHLRQVGVFIDMRFLNRPEIMLSEAHNKFDASGKLTDNFAHDLLKKLVNTLTAQPE